MNGITKTDSGLKAYFAWPSGLDANYEAAFPSVDTQTPAYAATIAVTVDQPETFITPAQLTGAATLNLTLASDLKAGAKIHLRLTADGSNRVVTLGTGFLAPAITVVASKTHTCSYVYNGTSFAPMGAAVQTN